MTLVMLFVADCAAPPCADVAGDRHQLRLRQRVGDRRSDLGKHLDLPVAEVALAAGL